MALDWMKSVGLDGAATDAASEARLIGYINLKLAYLGCPTFQMPERSEFDEMATALLSYHQETQRLLSDYRCPADQRIQEFITDYLGDAAAGVSLPTRTFVLDRYGLARALSLPPDKNEFVSDIVHSYRVKQGVLHNPKSDRRTTEGIFHIAEGGLPIPDDKKAVPAAVFAALLNRAFDPPKELLRLPFTSAQARQAECFVSLLLRPLVCPAVEGFTPEKRMEIRFFAPGNLVSNLDFVESIFGNAGDPYLPENDAGLDVTHWTGHTGCVILAPHLVGVTKKAVGLPQYDFASERQRRDGMCWKSEDERYNDGGAFKITCRDARGVMVTILADNYFGYCKKEVKTQISLSANLYGLCEEEHAGGALVFPSYDLGEEFVSELHAPQLGYTFAETLTRYADMMEMQPEGHGVDKNYADIVYVPQDVRIDLLKQSLSWTDAAGEKRIKLLPGKSYVRPSGHRIHLEKVVGTSSWRLVGTLPEGTFCHKPCTVSGGGKSEISKPLTDAVLQRSVYIADFQKDFDQAKMLIEHNYGDRFLDPLWRKKDSRTLLSPERSLGSVIKLLTPATREYSSEYNVWLRSIPQDIKELVFVVKRMYQPEWGDDWRSHFSVDLINGAPGKELRCDGRKLFTSFLRVGFTRDDSWRTFGLRKDFHAAVKIQTEDDISASVVVPSSLLADLNPEYAAQPAVKFVQNCEFRLFQRPDDAVHRGYDKVTERDFSRPGNFLSNYQPLTTQIARDMVDDSIGFDQFTPPMRTFIQEIAETGQPEYFVSSSNPRLVEGKPTKNPRYLQTRLDLLDPREKYLAEMGMRMHRRIPLGKPIPTPVNAVLPGRRNNPPDPAAGVRSLAVFNPIHYLETPELFMEFISSMTGKSPSTTGAGSEGALTKGPFNALPPIYDLNNAFVSHLLTGSHTFITAAAYVGPHLRVDHDVSLLVPEIWCRMSVEERDPRYLIQNGYLEKCEDLQYENRTVLTSRLGYRITRRFVRAFFGRIFNHPQAVFTDEALRPEKQDLALCIEGMDNIIATHKRVAVHYFNDGSIEMACPPLKALLYIMRDDEYQGKTLSDPDFRAQFTREQLLASDWYAAHLQKKQDSDIRLWERHIAYLAAFLNRPGYAAEAARLGISHRLAEAKANLARVQSPDYLTAFRQ